MSITCWFVIWSSTVDPNVDVKYAAVFALYTTVKIWLCCEWFVVKVGRRVRSAIMATMVTHSARQAAVSRMDRRSQPEMLSDVVSTSSTWLASTPRTESTSVCWNAARLQARIYCLQYLTLLGVRIGRWSSANTASVISSLGFLDKFGVATTPCSVW